MQERPRLCVVRATVLLVANRLDEIPARLQQAEQVLEAHAAGIEASEGQLLHGQITVLWQALTFHAGDLARSVAFAQQALELVPPTEPFFRTALMVMGAYAYRVSGDVTLASEQLVVSVVAQLPAFGEERVLPKATALLARLYVLQGRLQQAMATYAEAAQIAPSKEELTFLVNSPAYYFGLGDVLREIHNVSVPASGVVLIALTKVDGMPVHIGNHDIIGRQRGMQRAADDRSSSAHHRDRVFLRRLRDQHDSSIRRRSKPERRPS